MITQTQFDRIAHALPVLRRADPPLVREFMQAAFLARIPANHDVFAEGGRIEAIALLAGVFDFCVFAPLFGCPLNGKKIRAS